VLVKVDSFCDLASGYGQEDSASTEVATAFEVVQGLTCECERKREEKEDGEALDPVQGCIQDTIEKSIAQQEGGRRGVGTHLLRLQDIFGLHKNQFVGPNLINNAPLFPLIQYDLHVAVTREERTNTIRY
jgi:hypothetical protein